MEQYLAIIGGIYLVLSALAALTPSDKDDAFMSKIGRVLDKLGFNPRNLFK